MWCLGNGSRMQEDSRWEARCDQAYNWLKKYYFLLKSKSFAQSAGKMWLLLYLLLNDYSKRL